MADNEPYLVACEAQESGTDANKPLPSGRRLPFKYYTIRVDPETGELTGLPPGTFLDKNGKIRHPVLEGTYGAPDAFAVVPAFDSQGAGTTRQWFRTGFLASPYASSGASQYTTNDVPFMQAVSVPVTVAADGSVAAANLLAAHATKKYTIMDVYVSFGASAITASERPVVLNLTLSDGCGYVGTGAPMSGPVTQTTAATAIAYSAAAGACSPTAAGAVATLTARYRTST